jgi:hypothetical protein
MSRTGYLSHYLTNTVENRGLSVSLILLSHAYRRYIAIPISFGEGQHHATLSCKRGANREPL